MDEASKSKRTKIIVIVVLIVAFVTTIIVAALVTKSNEEATLSCSASEEVADDIVKKVTSKYEVKFQGKSVYNLDTEQVRFYRNNTDAKTAFDAFVALQKEHAGDEYNPDKAGVKLINNTMVMKAHLSRDAMPTPESWQSAVKQVYISDVDDILPEDVKKSLENDGFTCKIS